MIVYTYTNVHIYTYTHTHIYTYTHTYISYIHIHIYTHTDIHIHTHIYMCVYVCVCVCVCVYPYIFIVYFVFPLSLSFVDIFSCHFCLTSIYFSINSDFLLFCGTALAIFIIFFPFILPEALCSCVVLCCTSYLASPTVDSVFFPIVIIFCVILIVV